MPLTTACGRKRRYLPAAARRGHRSAARSQGHGRIRKCRTLSQVMKRTEGTCGTSVRFQHTAQTLLQHHCSKKEGKHRYLEDVKRVGSIRKSEGNTQQDEVNVVGHISTDNSDCVFKILFSWVVGGRSWVVGCRSVVVGRRW